MKENILKNLSWNASLNSQKKAIYELASMVNLNPTVLLQPSDKEYWENAAKVLRLIGYPRIEETIPGLFEWLQDMNWPGASIVMELLQTLPKHVIIRYLESAASEALNADEEIWLYNLSTFLLYFNLQEYDFMSEEVYFALLKAKED